jgi:hypothetical protein
VPKRYVVSRDPANRWEIAFDLISVGPYGQKTGRAEEPVS